MATPTVRNRNRGRRAGSRTGVTDRLAEQAPQVTDQLKGGARAIKAEAARKVGTLGRLAREEAARLVDAPRARAAAKMRAVGGSVEKAAKLLRAVRGDALADYIDAATTAAERTADYLETSDLADVADDAADLMRRYPLLTAATLLAAGVAAGVAAGRLLRLAGSVDKERNGDADEEDDGDGDDDARRK